jgi:hypothetical protein
MNWDVDVEYYHVERSPIDGVRPNLARQNTNAENRHG